MARDYPFLSRERYLHPFPSVSQKERDQHDVGDEETKYPRGSLQIMQPTRCANLGMEIHQDGRVDAQTFTASTAFEAK